MIDVYTIAPASSKALWAVAAILVLLLGMVALFGFFTMSSQATRFELSAEGLRIGRTMYGRTIPWANLELAQARVVNLHETPSLQPVLRTNGIGLPGYQAGWFELREGKALLFVTDPKLVVAIPTREDYTLLLSVKNPQDFLHALRQRSGNP